MKLSARKEIAEAYAGKVSARTYIADRFASELYRLLHDRQVRAVNSVLNKFASGYFLEIAPGPARLTSDVRHAGELVCVEYNWAMIEVGKRRCRPTVHWVCGDAFSLPFRQVFDAAYAFRFFRHFRKPERHRLYQEMRRVLKPRGYLLFDALNARGPWPRNEPAVQSSPFPPVYDKFYHDTQELRDEMLAAGFQVLNLEPVHRWYRSQYWAQVLIGPRSRLLCRLAIRALERLGPGPAMEWIVTCRCA